MLSSEKLITLYRESRSQHVLSVYLDAGRFEPAQKSAWHRAFLDGTREARRLIEEGDGDPGTFDNAVAQLSGVLGDPQGFLHGRGWVGFATGDRVLYGEAVPVPMPNLVRWEPGIRVAPYLRALEQARPVGAAVVDGRRARLFRYQGGRLEERGELLADRDFGDLNEATGSKRAATSTGVRGATGKDREQALSSLETDRMLESVAKELAGVAGPEGFVVLGGVDEVVSRLRKSLPRPLAERSATRSRLSFDLAASEVLPEIEAAASELSRARQATLLGSVFDLALSGGAACIGRDDTDRAIEERRVRMILVSETLRQSEPDAVDRLVGRAFESGASAVEISGDAVSRLDGEGAGVAALLHYRAENRAAGS